MIIQLKHIPAYILHSPKYPKRLINIRNVCHSLFLSGQEFISDTIEYSHQQNVAYDSWRMIQFAMTENIYPFIMLEDDALIIDHIPSEINIPNEEFDLIYYGSNKSSGPPVLKNKLSIQEFDNDYYRLYNSQSTHAIVVPNESSGKFLKDIYKIAFDTNQYHDVILPNLSHQKIFLTPKDGPYFYQNDKHKDITKFKWKEFIQNI